MSPPPEPELLRLAPELIDNVIKQISDRRDLSKIRLACKSLDKHAVNELFKDILVSPLKGHVDTWRSVSQNEAIRQLPRHAVIQTQPDIENHGMGHTRERYEADEDDEDYPRFNEDDEDDEDYPSFNDAIAAMARFPNLTSIEIRFTPECVGGDAEYYQEIAEDLLQRKCVLRRIFQAIKDRAADEKNRTIRKLTIVNLQNCPLPEFTSSDLFREVMAQLHELHIGMTQEFNEHGPDHDYTKTELQTFPAYFCSHWLKPISDNLKALSIYSAMDNWGPFPGYFDPREISFPQLERLALGYYTLAHDNDLDWVLAIKSLRKLTLHNCMINSWICISRENIAEWGMPMHDWTKISGEDDDSWCETFSYNGKWSQQLDCIAKELPNLVDFQFGYGSSYSEPTYSVTDRDACGTNVFPERYVCFNNGILPTHWLEMDGEGEMGTCLDGGFPVNKHKENLEADQKSLDALLGVLRSRR